MLQILDAGVEPRLLDIEYIAVAAAGGFVLVVRVPASFEGPHWVKREGTRNFFVRREVANIEMTYFEVKSAFDRSSAAIERGRAFRSARSKIILENAGLAIGPKCVVHYLPLASLSGRVSIDVKSLYRSYGPLMLSGWGGASRILNLDGLLITPGRNRNGNGHEGYVQLFREGLFEAVSRVGNEYQDRPTVGAGSLGEFIREAIAKLMDCASQFGLRGTAMVSVSVFGMSGQTLVYKADPYGYAVSDRADLVFPEVSVSRLPDGAEREAFVREVLDVVWQGFDLEFCTLYDADGRWRP